MEVISNQPMLHHQSPGIGNHHLPAGGPCSQHQLQHQQSIELPQGTSFLDSQVSGHEFNFEKQKIGILRGPKGRILKPILKPVLGAREQGFYENLQNSKDQTDLELLRFTAAYHGTKELRIFDQTIKFLQLTDITDGMIEPCVMDVKIGKVTWDPEATPEKRESESRKYSECKDAYGFCIPGFQVYNLQSGSLKKYGKDYGKQLNPKSIVEALEIFLNKESNKPPCRDLVVRLLSILWKILALFRMQHKYRLYSSSLLIAYDANRLRHLLREHDPLFGSKFSPSRSRTYSAGASTLHSPPPSPVSPTAPMQISFDVNVKDPTLTTKSTPPSRSPRNRTIAKLRGLQRSISLNKLTGKSKSNQEVRAKDARPIFRRYNSTDPNAHKLCRTHSYINNFDVDIVQMKEDYAVLLAELSSTCEEKQDWVKVYMIDFAHVFPGQESHGTIESLDTNYLEGIENLIKILEGFL